jgi:hypothetical protein
MMGLNLWHAHPNTDMLAQGAEIYQLTYRAESEGDSGR